MADAIGAMRERLVLQQNVPPTVAVGTLSRSGATVTVVTSTPHGFLTNDYVTVAGATPVAYNGRVKVTVVDPLTFTFTVSGSPTTPATGTITAVYVSDAQGGRRDFWRTFDSNVFAEMVPLKADERIQLAALQPSVSYQFRIWNRADLSPTMRALWTPAWPRNATRRVLQITGILPWLDPWSAGERYLLLQMTEVSG